MSLLLFDLDGTLYSSRGILPDAYRRGIEAFNDESNQPVEVPTDEQIFNQVGKPAPEIYENLFPELNDREANKLQEQIFSALLEYIREGKGNLYDGVESVLATLDKSYQLGLVTNAQTAYMENVLETHKLNRFFEKALCHDDAPGGRKSELVAMMLEHYGVNSEESRMIGDRQSDYNAASEHGVSFIHCTYGYGTSDVFPDSSQIESFEELTDGTFLPSPKTA